MSEKMSDRHIPFVHKDHTNNIPCGCCTDLDSKELKIRCDCEAVYLWREVITFPIFHCYDCNRFYDSRLGK